ncbi:carbohydrate ABC transporter permease [Clostridium sp. SYSU_GA19001]|uniref:carbohydrate ABC transporter permease n=1 Tax=Clostridium caldaquaticum TaxID=2940653 RepID=UPI002077495A|nr:carbohydrate ABC transporter permease [Clostridium caldaquaticum]MCM8712039.1 carbohydrate ABC transporter permease [Clostridium caldaquaticum]
MNTVKNIAELDNKKINLSEVKTYKIKKSKATILFNILGYSLVSFVAVLCLLPFIMLISGSFSSERAISNLGYGILPREFNTDAYKLLFRYPQDIIRAYGVSIFITVVGTALGLFVITMTAYVLNRKDFKYRNKLAFFFYFTTLFNGGLVSTYIFMIRYLHLKNSFLSLILPLLINVFYLLVMRSFMNSIPESIIESAKIDGAGDFTIFIKLILPLSKAGLATIGLFIALDYWNDWYNAMLYMTEFKKFPLQYMLYNMLSSTEAMSRISSASSVAMANMPSQSLKLAMAVIATGPIILVYPFVQKYFVKGITVGAVKG